MARVTVDDSLKNVKNRFELVLLASKRARDLTFSGEEPNVPWGNDKATVVALREIADGYIKADYLLKESPKPKQPEYNYNLNDDVDFNLDDDSDAALIAALTTKTVKLDDEDEGLDEEPAIEQENQEKDDE